MKVLANRIEACFGFALLILVLFGFAVWRTATRSLETFHQVARSEKMGQCLELTLVQTLNMETGVRGFVISGQERFLEPYLQGIAAGTNALAGARALATESQQPRFAKLERLIQQKLAFMEKTIETRRRDGITAATEQIASGQGKQTMDEIRSVIGELENEESMILENRLNVLETEARWTIAIAIGSGVVAFVLVGLAGIQVLRDVHGRQTAEAEARLASDRLALATRAGNLGIWDWNIVTGEVFWDDGMYTLLGTPRENVVPSHQAFLDALHPGDRERIKHEIETALREGKSSAAEFRIIWPDGSVHYLQANSTILRSESGKAVRMLGTNWDVTERVQMENALRQSEETLRLLAESMPQMVWMCRPDGWNIYFNQQWVDYTGLTLEQSHGHGWNIPFHPDDKSRAWNAWNKATETGGKYDLECRLRRADGAYRWFLIRGVPLRNDRGEILKWFGTCTDIDVMKKAEGEINLLNAKLGEHSANLEKQVSERTAALRDSIKSLETLTYTIAHDLRAPLRAMAGYTEALLEDVPLNETGRQYAEQIHHSAERMSHLIKDLLDYGQLTHLEVPISPVSFATEIEKLIRHFEIEIRQTKADVGVEDDMPVVMANARLLDQVLSNLLSNAMKFVAPGATPKIRLRAEKRGVMARLWMEDNGIGIAAEYQDQIFGVFHRLHTAEEYPGTGVGLAIVKRAVEMMKGRIGVESEVNKGSRFWIELPLAKDQRRKGPPELKSITAGRTSDTEWLQKQAH